MNTTQPRHSWSDPLPVRRLLLAALGVPRADHDTFLEIGVELALHGLTRTDLDNLKTAFARGTLTSKDLAERACPNVPRSQTEWLEKLARAKKHLS